MMSESRAEQVLPIVNDGIPNVRTRQRDLLSIFGGKTFGFFVLAAIHIVVPFIFFASEIGDLGSLEDDAVFGLSGSNLARINQIFETWR